MKVIFGTDAIKHPLTGIGRYAFELATRLSLSPEISEFLFLCGRTLSDRMHETQDSDLSNEKLKNFIKKSRIASEFYRLTSPWLKTQVLRKHTDAIYHGPNFYLPPKVGRCVVTFHDLSIFTLPFCHPVERVRFMQKELLHTIRRAKIIITDSDYVRHELINYFNMSPSIVYSVKLACGNEFKPADEMTLLPLLSKYKLKYNQYTLFTGSIEPRKNLDTLLDAYECLPMSIRSCIPLVVSGFRGWKSESLHIRFEKAQRAGWLKYLGYTPASDLPGLYAGARSFLFPSLYEGFGLPVLEAMSSGIPVVCSNSSSLPEVTGGYALMCEPMDVELLTELIHKSIDDEIWRMRSRRAGLEHAKQFSWERCAEETIFAYKQVE